MTFISPSHRELVRSYGTLFARVVVGVFFISAGVGKVGTGFGLGAGFAGTVGYVGSVGLPMPEALTLAAAVLEIGGGLGVLLGFYFAEAAAALTLVCVFTAIFFHGNMSDPMQKVQMFKNLSIAGGLLYMIGYGSGTGWKISCHY